MPSPSFHLLLHQEFNILLHQLRWMAMWTEEGVVGTKINKSFEEEIGESIKESALVLLDVVVPQQLDTAHPFRQTARLPHALTTFLS